MKINDPTLVDPNPTEVAECSFTVSCGTWEELDGDRIFFAIFEMYDEDPRFDLVFRMLRSIEANNETLVYVGTRKKCEEYNEAFQTLGLRVDIEAI
jgi:hypothetical protein